MPTTPANLALPLPGTFGSLSNGSTIVIRARAAPFVRRVTTPLADGSYAAGTVVPIDVVFSEPLYVLSQYGYLPRLALNALRNGTRNGADGSDSGGPGLRAAELVDGNGTSTLRFEYVVRTGDDTTALDYGDPDTSLWLEGGRLDAGRALLKRAIVHAGAHDDAARANATLPPPGPPVSSPPSPAKEKTFGVGPLPDCPARFIRTASVLNGCTTIQPITPPRPEVEKMTLLLRGLGSAIAARVGSLTHARRCALSEQKHLHVT